MITDTHYDGDKIIKPELKCALCGNETSDLIWQGSPKGGKLGWVCAICSVGIFKGIVSHSLQKTWDSDDAKIRGLSDVVGIPEQALRYHGGTKDH